MGPLVPDIISNNLNFIVALLIGILFGAILEQAGFSSSRKLVGLFYGYDFTVLRVFFTAGITAMLGVMAFVHYGLLDVNLIYINPTFLWSAIIGGLIMGLGFVVGGYCPGTSLAGAAIGKIDAWYFVGGSFLGVLIYAEGYPVFEGLYKSANMGSPRLFETLGMSQTLFAFLLTAIAIAAFWMTSIVENRVNGTKKEKIRMTPLYAGLTAIGIIMALSAFVLPDRKAYLLEKAEDKEFVSSYIIPKMSIDEFAYRLMDEDNKLQVIDFRSEKDFSQFSLPKSTLFTVDNLFEKEPNQALSVRHKINVIIADDENTEKKIAIIASEVGYNNIKILENGLNGFKQQILSFKPASDTLQISDTNRFRAKAASVIAEMIKQNKQSGPVKKTQKRVVGGC